MTADRWSREVAVAQVHQVLHGWECVERVGGGYRTTDALAAVLDRWGGVGVIYGLFRSDPWSGRDHANGVVPEARAEVAGLVQAQVRAASGGIGVLLAEEATHGALVLGATTLPTNLAQAATWDPDLVRAGADAVGRSLRADGVHLAFVSGADVCRDPRWGRSEETFGEDPNLASSLTEALVLGMQGGPRIRPATHPGAVLKHVAGQGGAVGGRNAMSVPVGRTELAEVHLPPVLAGVRAGAVGVMAAYNDVDGVPCVANRWLLTDLLRRHWNFDGIVMADALSVDRLAEAVGAPEAARRALLAGCDLNLGDAAWATLAHPGDEPTEKALRRAATRVRRLKESFGLLPGLVPATPQAPAAREVIEMSRALARAGLVALGAAVSPVPAGASVVVTGPFADRVESLLGDYSPPLAADERPRSLAEAVSARFPAARHVGWHDPGLPAAAADADVVVVQLGGTSERRYGGQFAATGAVAEAGLDATCGEGVDVADLLLPHGQDERLGELRRATAARIIGVAVMGRPHILTRAVELCDDVIVAWYPGPFGGDAVADVLAGELSATGRLPVTLLREPGAVGWHDNDRVGRVDPRYADLPDPVLAPLGGGAPSTFTVVDWRVAPTPTGHDVTLLLRADGPASDVVRVHGRRSGGQLWPRRRALLGFRRVTVAEAGELEASIAVADVDAFGVPGPVPGLPVADNATACELTVEPFGLRATIEPRREGVT